MIARSCPLALALIPVAAAPATAQSPLLNEILVREEGIDQAEFVELRGTPGSSLDGVLVLAVDGAAATAGLLDLALDLSGHVLPADGYFLIGSTNVPGADLLVSGANWLRNRTQTLYLVRTTDVPGLLALVGSDLDPDGDGETLLPGIATVLDRVALVDLGWTAGHDRIFDGAPVRGPEGWKVPAGIFRSADNGNWCTGFLLPGPSLGYPHHPQTPGSANVECTWNRRVLGGAVRSTSGFGEDIDVTDGEEFLLAGSLTTDFTGGAVHVIDALTGDTVRLLTLAQPPPFGGFGWRVDSSRDRALIASPGSDAVFVFDWTTGQELARLDPPSGAEVEGFGFALALDGNLAVVGSDPGLDLVGAVWVYDATSGALLHELAPPFPLTGMAFGRSVAVHEGTVLVGAPWYGEAGSRTGVAYLFDGASGALLLELLPTPGQEGGWLGAGVELDGEHIVVSAPFEGNGGLHLYERATAQWTGFLESPHPPFPVGGLRWEGRALDLLEGRALVGVRGELGALLFDLRAPGPPEIVDPAGTWLPVGESVALSATSAFLGTPHLHLDMDRTGAVIEQEIAVGRSFCDAAASSLGLPARISARGSASLAAEDLVLQAGPVPAGRPGLFFYGSLPTQVPFGPGTRCVGGLIARLPVEVSSPGGELEHILDTDAAPSAFVAIEPFSTWHFQAWFRDPAGAGFQLSDGLQVTFRP